MKIQTNIEDKKSSITTFSLKEIFEKDGVYVVARNHFGNPQDWRFIVTNKNDVIMVHTKTQDFMIHDYKIMFHNGWNDYKFILSDEEISIKFSN